ncbi:MAG: HypC/HybG/HupF family hydrogenase formation chaperone [Haloarculaceae archaeon]
MCLGVPGEVQEIEGDEAVVDFWGVERRVRIDIVGDEIEPGDYILNHVGFAIQKIPEEEVEETLELFESMLDADRDDMLTDDVVDELEAGAGAPGPAGPGGAGSAGAPDDADGADGDDDGDLLDDLGIDV